VANSFSYYEEKLGGRGVGTILLRSVATPVEELQSSLAGLGVERIEPLDVPAAGARARRRGRPELTMQALELNLASRPFKNNTLPWVGLSLALALLVGVTVWNVRSYQRHTPRSSSSWSRATAPPSARSSSSTWNS
jgi:hypothetical protein